MPHEVTGRVCFSLRTGSWLWLHRARKDWEYPQRANGWRSSEVLEVQVRLVLRDEHKSVSPDIGDQVKAAGHKVTTKGGNSALQVPAAGVQILEAVNAQTEAQHAH